MTYRPTDAEVAEALDLLRRVTGKWPQVKTEGVDRVMDWLAVNAPGPDLIDAQRTFRKELQDEGEATCPCCDHTHVVRKRVISTGMAAALVRLYHLSPKAPDGWVHALEWSGKNNSGDYAKLRFWGLIERKDRRTSTDNASGMWRITDKGKQYAEDRLALPKVLYVYRNRVIGAKPGTPNETIRQAFKNPFDYSKMMTPGMP